MAIPEDDSTKFNYDKHRQHVVFCGTEILQGKASNGRFIKAVVIRTGKHISYPVYIQSIASCINEPKNEIFLYTCNENNCMYGILKVSLQH